MTFARGTAQSAQTPSDSTTLTYSVTVASGQNLLMVGAGVGISASTITGVTFNGTSLSAVGNTASSAWGRAYIWRLDNPAVGTYDLVVTSSSTNQIAATALPYTDASLTLGTSSGNSGTTATNPQITGVASVSGDDVFAFYFDDAWGSGGTDQTAIAASPGVSLYSDHNSDSSFAAQYRVASGTTTDIVWTTSDTGGGWASHAVAISPLRIVEVQSASASNADPVVATFGATPTEGNLLVCVAGERAGTGTTPFTISGTGWTKRVGHDVSLGDTTYRRSLTVWQKVAGASEPTAITVDDGTANLKSVVIAEFNSNVAGASWVFDDDATADNGNTANATSLASGNTASIADGQQLVIGAAFFKQGNVTTTVAGDWSSISLAAADAAQGAANGSGIYVSAAHTTGAGTKASTVAFTGTDTSNNGLIASVLVFRSEVVDPPQFARPSVDVSDGAWTPSTGTDNFAVLDESTFSDADYSSVNSNSTLRVGLSSVSTPAAGTRTLRYRAAGSPDKKLIVRLIENTTTKETFTTDPLPATVTAYSQTVTASISNYADLDVEFEIADATSPPTLQVTWGAIGTSGAGTTSCTPSYPTGISAATSKLYCMVTGRSNTANTAPTMPAGWTSIGALEGGTGTWGVDTGTRRVQLFVKDTVTGSETGTVTVSLTGSTANTMRASIFRVEVPSGYGIDVSVGTGADTSNDTSYSATSGTSLAFAPNDLLVVGTAQNLDTGTGTSAFSATSITFGTVTRRANTATTNGNDHRHIVATASVTAGTATSAPTHSYTVSAAASGPSLFARMRAVAPTEKGRVTWAEFEVPAAGSLSGTAAESVALSDGQTVTASLGVSQGESVAIADGQVAVQVTARAIDESVAVADSQDANVTQVASFTPRRMLMGVG